MSEVYWPEGGQPLMISPTVWYAMTFSPLFSHDCTHIRFIISFYTPLEVVLVSIQYLLPDGTPSGVDLTSVRASASRDLPLFMFNTLDKRCQEIRLIEGVKYALVIHLAGIIPFQLAVTQNTLAPSGYPRGKLIRSTNAGVTWDTTDRGALLFGEYGDPPVKPNPYTPPIVNWTITEFSQHAFLESACTRVATTEPSTIECFVTDVEPKSIETYKLQRGAKIRCLDYIAFKEWRSYQQKESYDSMYHTFYITGLKAGRKYWICFTGRSAFLSTNSKGPIIEVTHPIAPPFETVKRPNASGSANGIPFGTPYGAPNHYKDVNEATPDDDASYVMNNSIATCWRSDLYNVPDLLPYDAIPIADVALTGRFAFQYGYSYASGAKLLVKTHLNIYQSETISYLGMTYSNHSWHLHTNPSTHLPWTKDEVDSMEIGVSLQAYYGVGWATFTKCSQLFATITHECSAYF